MYLLKEKERKGTTLVSSFSSRDTSTTLHLPPLTKLIKIAKIGYGILGIKIETMLLQLATKTP
jgi:hypothetical protein